jgi:hypothetical protein
MDARMAAHHHLPHPRPQHPQQPLVQTVDVVAALVARFVMPTGPTEDAVQVVDGVELHPTTVCLPMDVRTVVRCLLQHPQPRQSHQQRREVMAGVVLLLVVPPVILTVHTEGVARSMASVDLHQTTAFLRTDARTDVHHKPRRRQTQLPHLKSPSWGLQPVRRAADPEQSHWMELAELATITLYVVVGHKEAAVPCTAFAVLLLPIVVLDAKAGRAMLLRLVQRQGLRQRHPPRSRVV